MKTKLWWELAITHDDGSTQSVEHPKNIAEGLAALLDRDPEENAFLDLWYLEEGEVPYPYSDNCGGGTGISREDLVKVLMGEIIHTCKETKKTVNLQQAHKIGESIENIIPYIADAREQFEAWEADNSQQKKALCPTRNSVESEAWDSSVKVAMDAILNMEEFVDKTEAVDTLHYATRIKPWTFKEERPIIEGRRIDNASCMRIFQSDRAGRYAGTVILNGYHNCIFRFYFIVAYPF